MTTISERALAIRPRAFTLELTKGCNLRCGYCYYAQREAAYAPSVTMSPETAARSVDLLIEQSRPGETLHRHCSGGGPLLNLPILEYALEYASKRAQETGRRFTFELTTNGTRFSEAAITLVNRYELQVGVSFDGPPELQDVARPLAGGGSSTALALPGLRQFMSSRQGTPLEEKTHASVVLTRRSLDLCGIQSYLEGLGFRRIIFSPATDLKGVSEGLTPNDLPAIFAAYDRLAVEHEARRARGEVPPDTWFGELFEALVSGAKKDAFCGGGRDYLGVAADGQVYLCYRFYEDKTQHMGSVHSGLETGVTERLLADPIDERTACGRCWARHFCGGGCHHDNLLATGGLGDPNPVTCEIFRHSMGRTLEMWARLSHTAHGAARRQPATENSMKPPSSPPAPGSHPKTRSTCHAREIQNPDGRTERVVYEPSSHEVVVLNGTASLIFDLCDGSRTHDDLVSELVRRYAAPREVLARDLASTLSHFAAKGLLAP